LASGDAMPPFVLATARSGTDASFPPPRGTIGPTNPNIASFSLGGSWFSVERQPISKSVWITAKLVTETQPVDYAMMYMIVHKVD
jgi:hypothetical protein